MKKGLTLIELLVALLLAGLVVGFAVTMLRDENSNMIHVRSRVQSQTAARDGMKILESELRAAGFGVSMRFATSPADPIQMTSVNPVCAAEVDIPKQSSVVAMDGVNGGNDTLDLAYPLMVDPRYGADCGISARWVRYLVDKGELKRFETSTRAGLSNATPTVVGRNVDVFQVQLGASGIARNGKLFLTGADSCCPGGSNWTPTGGATVTGNAAAKTDELSLGSTGAWSYLSTTSKTLSAGETWRIRFTIQSANTSLLADLGANSSSFVKVGLYSASGNILLPILSVPASASAGFGKLVEADLSIPTNGTYQLGLSGNAGTAGGKLFLKGFNAYAVRLGSDSTWLKDPSGMNPDDWTRVKSVRVQILTRAPADKKDYTSKFTGLANYKQASTSPVGEFNVTDTSIRVLLDHLYPAGNNGKL